ncbi:hypothetical protein G5C51_25965 [Streptomyces sp. A7024]|uniref:Uncharacterized protein n=1 Tax=Streptomyces coryli TaxID=1128680 RepID=A0A6G4U7R3_9ACTN|nr:hypothetical protein [Streptomyces coryli]NGN67337.1 hypothetical protein [Streptomyces coryli]
MRQVSVRWGRSVRSLAVQWGGWAAVSGGAVLCVIGWYGISGERFAERQLPYLASCTIPGAALIIAGAILLARGDQGLAAARVEELYGLLVASDAEPEAEAAPVARANAADGCLTVPGGTLYHRPDCPLVRGKADAEAVDAEARAARGLTPCPVCEPAEAPLPEA